MQFSKPQTFQSDAGLCLCLQDYGFEITNKEGNFHKKNAVYSNCIFFMLSSNQIII